MANPGGGKRDGEGERHTKTYKLPFTPLTSRRRTNIHIHTERKTREKRPNHTYGHIKATTGTSHQLRYV